MSDSDSVLLVADGLGCERGDRPLFAGVGLTLRAGEVHELRGPNGSGKTTLLRCLCGLGRADAGEVRLSSAASDAQPPFHYLGHAGSIKLELSARENLAAARAAHGGPTLLSMDQALSRVALDHAADRQARSLSAGQRRRVALARLLCAWAPLWVLDEPLTALDDDGVALVCGFIEAHARAGGAVIVSTHQPLAVGGVPVTRHRLRGGDGT